MRQIVQLEQSEYDSLCDTARFNKRQIDEKAVELWKSQAIARINVHVVIGDTYVEDFHIDCSTSVFNKDDRFTLPQENREKLAEEINAAVKDGIAHEYGEAATIIRRYREWSRALHITRYLLWGLALSGWTAFAACLILK